MITYKATGIVLGYLWGGGQGGYPARVITSDNLTNLRQQVKDGIEDGSLDSGMGFQSLTGALMCIETIDTRKIDGKTFVAVDYEDELFGDLTQKQKDLLADAEFVYS